MDKYKSVDEYLLGLDEDRRNRVLLLRKYILDAVPSLNEHIKWNAPSYCSNGEDRITFNTLNKEQTVKLVFHMGTTRKEVKKGTPILPNSDMIDWVSDIRGYVTFDSLKEITSQEKQLKQLVRQWFALTQNF